MAHSPKESFGRYELVSKLGRGGMAETWRARLLGAAGVTKPVLIKKVLTEYANDQAFISMFISEARISATLSHGNIAQVFDFGRADGEYFLAMEFVDGQPLHRVIKRALKSGLKGIPVPLATFIALEMCRGLHYAHTRRDDQGKLLGIVHRDVSPDNVLVSYEGQIKIVDFGIAKARALRGVHTEPGVVKGKYLFFSPEQARGEEVDARTDVWATGIVLYEMLCGQLPVTGPQYTALPRLVGGTFPRPSELRPELPAELDDIVMRALAVDVDQRFESSHAFGDALAGFLYSSAPRFSSLSVAHLLQELFREDLSAEGREVHVPRSFLEELSLWRSSQAPRAPAPRPSSHPTRPAPLTSGEPASELDSSEHPTSKSRVEQRQSRLTLVSIGVVLLVLVAVIVGMELKDKAAEEVSLAAQPLPAPPPPSLAVAAPRPIERPAPPPTAPAPAPSPAVPDPPAPRAPTWNTVIYPVPSVRLAARRDVILVPTRRQNSHPLTEGRSYLLMSTLSPPDSPPPFFWLRGAKVSTNDEVGRLSATKAVQIRAGTSVTFFRLASAEGSGTRRVDDVTHTAVLMEQQVSSSTQVIVYPDALAPLTQALELKGLEGTAVYELRLASVGPGAYLRGSSGPPTRKVACARRGGEDVVHIGEEGEYTREQQFLLQEGKPFELSGATAILCGFLDDDPSDNWGEMELRIKLKSRATTTVTRVEPPTAAPPAIEPPAAAPPQATPPRPASAPVSPPVVDLLAEGKALLKAQQFREAETLLRRCIATDPKVAECHLMLGAAMARIGRLDEGAREYREFLRLADPQDKSVPKVKLLLEQYEKSRR